MRKNKKLNKRNKFDIQNKNFPPCGERYGFCKYITLVNRKECKPNDDFPNGGYIEYYQTMCGATIIKGAATKGAANN